MADPFRVRIFIMDLAAFVQDEKSMWILLPDATKATHMHHPVVIFHDTDITGQGDWKDVKKVLGLSEVGLGHAWLLDREDINIPPSDNPDLAVIRSDIGMFPDPANAKSFSWVPRMWDFSPGSAKAYPPLLEKTPDDGKLKERVIARLQLTDGTLETFAFVKLKRWYYMYLPMIRLFGFSDNEIRALADVAVVTLNFSARTKIDTTRHDGSASSRQPFYIDKSMDMLVGNISPAKFRDESSKHFRYYYEKLSDAVKEEHIPSLSTVLFRSPAGVESNRPDVLEGVEEPPEGFLTAFLSGFKFKSLLSGFKFKFAIFVFKILVVILGGYNRPICSLVEMDK
jgi:hypothetical protein